MQVPTRLGRYELHEELGRGGAGVVYAATLLGPGGFRRPVALKVLTTHRAVPTDLIEEARLGAMLQHPNLVSTWEVGEADGRWFLAMELVRGPTVRALAASTRLSGRAVVSIGRAVCSALTHLHGFVHDRGRGIVHRDVKPGNLLVDPHGIVKLADLGIAGVAAAPGVGAGTPGYAAPEQLLRQEGPPADLFALGATLFALVVGRSPFAGSDDVHAATLAVERRLAGRSFLAPLDQVVPGLADVVARCLRRRPEDRWASAAELSAALAALQPTGASVRQALGITDDPDATVLRQEASTVVGPAEPVVGEFVGREAELRELLTACSTPGLVTLTALGGTGKTRLAVEVARRSGDAFTAVWFVETERASSAASLAQAVGRVVGLAPDADPELVVPRALAAQRRALLVLDNFEQLVDAAATTVSAWLRAAPHLSLLVTSRRPLRVADERVVELDTLPPPDAEAMFRSRAGLGTDADPGLVRRIVTLLDGHALSIDLAAGRTRRLPLAAVARGLEERLRLLTSTDRDRTDRNRSVRSSLDATWAQLTEPERSALAQLSVFHAPVDLDALDAVVDVRPAWTLDALDGLAEHHLLGRTDDDRFTMLPLVREYARSKCSPEQWDQVTLRHAQHYAQFGSEEWRDALTRHGGMEIRARLRAALAEFDAACDGALRLGRYDLVTACFDVSWPLGSPESARIARALSERAPDPETRLEFDAMSRVLQRTDRGAEGLLDRFRSIADPRPRTERAVLAALRLSLNVRSEIASALLDTAEVERRDGHELEARLQEGMAGYLTGAPDLDHQLERLAQDARERGHVQILLRALDLRRHWSWSRGLERDLTTEEVTLGKQWFGPDDPRVIRSELQLHLQNGDLASADTVQKRGLLLIERWGGTHAQRSGHRLGLLSAATEIRTLGDEDARVAIARLEEVARQDGSGHHVVLACWLRAMIGFDRDDVDEIDRAADVAEGIDPRSFREQFRSIPRRCRLLARSCRGSVVVAPDGDEGLGTLLKAWLGDLGLPGGPFGPSVEPATDWMEAWAALAAGRAALDRGDPAAAEAALAGVTGCGLHLYLLGQIELGVARGARARSTAPLEPAWERLLAQDDPFLAFRAHLARARLERTLGGDTSGAVRAAATLATTWRRRRELFRLGFGPRVDPVDEPG